MYIVPSSQMPRLHCKIIRLKITVWMFRECVCLCFNTGFLTIFLPGKFSMTQLVVRTRNTHSSTPNLGHFRVSCKKIWILIDFNRNSLKRTQIKYQGSYHYCMKNLTILVFFRFIVFLKSIWEKRSYFPFSQCTCKVSTLRLITERYSLQQNTWASDVFITL